MKIVDDSITLVIVGKWNKSILTPDWVSQYLFKTPTVQFEFSLNPDFPVRYTADNIRLSLFTDKIIFTALIKDEAVFSRLESMARELVTLLPHTPISAFGINLSCSIEDIPSEIASLFQFTDVGLISDENIEIVNSSIKRTLNFSGDVCNFTITNNSSNILFEFNFHTPSQQSSVFLEKCSGKISRNINQALSFLRSIYRISESE